MAQRLIVDASRCQGCLACLTLCSMTKEGVSAPSRARLKVELDPLGGSHRITACRQCKKAQCAEACPVDAIQLEPAGRYWTIDYNTCTGCRECIEPCSFGAMLYDPIAGRVLKCDTCEGSPACAEICPTGALTWSDGTEGRR